MKWWSAACLAAPAQILFSSRPLTGAWLVLGVLLLSPPHALGLLLGLLTATGLASYARWNRLLLSQGIFGLNGALVGLVWPSLFPLGSTAFWLVIPVSAVTLAVQGRLFPPFTKMNLPVLTLPFILVTWGVVLLGQLFGFLDAPQVIPPSITGPLAGWNDPVIRQAVWDAAMMMAPGVIALGVAAWVTSWMTLRAALAGALSGLATALCLGGLQGFFWVGSYVYSAAPLTVAVAGIFFPYSRRSLVVGMLSGCAGVLCWVGIVWSTFPLGLFPLTLPLNSLLLGLIALERTRVGHALFRLQPIPLEEVGRPRASDPGRAAPPIRVDEGALSTLEGLIRRSSKILALTGAGVSTESRIPDYRTQIGFWFDANAEDLTYSRFLASSHSQWLYWRLQRRFFGVMEVALPNQTHWSLVDLESRGKLLGIVTQNVDGLHQKAGTSPERIVEIHGNASTVTCLGCGAQFRYEPIHDRLNMAPPRCEECGGLLKVDVVSIGEPIPGQRVRQAYQWGQEADLLLVLGSSLLIEPAASLLPLVSSRAVPVVIVNGTPTAYDALATLTIHASLGAVWAALSRRLASPTADLRIRPMNRADFLYLMNVVDEWWGESVRYLLHPLFLEHFADTTLVCETNGELIGFLVGLFSQSKPGEAYVHLVGTHPAHRKRGVARALYEHLFSLARKQGGQRVSAITVPYNSGSLAFHRKMGFTFSDAGAIWQGDLPVSVNYAGPGIDCVVMERELTSARPLLSKRESRPGILQA